MGRTPLGNLQSWQNQKLKEDEQNSLLPKPTWNWNKIFFQNFGLVLVLVGLILEKKPSGMGGGGGGGALIPPLFFKPTPMSTLFFFFF